MYCIKYFESMFKYEKEKLKDVTCLEFPKTKDNFMFKIDVTKEKLDVAVEDENGEKASEQKIQILDGTKSIMSKFINETFADKEVTIYGFFDGKDYYIVDIAFNKRWFVQEDIDELAEKYKFKTLETVYEGDFDEKEIKGLGKTLLIKSRLEKDFFTISDKERYVIFLENKNE